MKDERKTKKQLIEELEDAYRRVAELEARDAEQMVDIALPGTLRQIYEAIWKMENADGFKLVFDKVSHGLGALGISFNAMGLNVIDASSEPPSALTGSYVADGSFRFFRMDDAEVETVMRMWRAGEPTYRKYPETKDSRSDSAAKWAIRTILDVPFSHGTLAINSHQPDAFSKRDIDVVQELADALSLGYTRYYDFQRLEEQAKTLKTQTEQAQKERAAERIRATAMAMEKSEDIAKVVLVLHEELARLGIESPMAAVNFVDEENQCLIGHYRMPNPRQFGLRPANSAESYWHFRELIEINVEDAVLKTVMSDDYLIEVTGKTLYEIWNNKQIHLSSWSKSRSDIIEELEANYECESDIRNLPDDHPLFNRIGDWVRHLVPFSYGAVGLSEHETNEEHIAIVEQLSEALSLGYQRFLDIRKVDEAQKKLIDELEEELQTAHDLQMGLMPTESPQIEGFDIAGRCIPANHVGGDFFQYFEQNGKLSICMADVTGHAMEAAVPVMMFSGVLKSQMELHPPMEALFGRLNRTMHDSLDSRTYVCFCMGELDVVAHTFHLANAACPYPFHFHASTGEVEEMQVDAYPLGVRDGTAYTAIETVLEPGDRIIFCSDGIIEAGNEREEIFGFEQTAETIRQGCMDGLSSEALIDRMLSAVKTFAGEAPQGDDQTMVVMVRVD